MRILAGSSSEVHFTHLSQACSCVLLKHLSELSAGTNADDIADVFCTTQGVQYLIRVSNWGLFGPSLSPRSQGHQEDGCQLFSDTPFSLLFLAYSALYCHFWPINFYNFAT